MTLPYAVRLVCLCLEMLFLVNLTASAVVLLLSRLTTHTAETMQPVSAARWFLGLRLLPSLLSLVVVALVCVPSYLRYEDNGGSESMGFVCLGMAVLGLGICLSMLYRGLRALAQIYALEQRLNSAHVQPSQIAEAEMCVAEADAPGVPLLALVGIMRPRLIVSRRLLDTLSAEQFEAALSHERAHLLGRDNLKRLLIAIAPGMFPFADGLSSIEKQWERYAELAADDNAARGRSGRSVALAEALVQVARLGNGVRRIPLASSLSESNVELSRRVNRLMTADPAMQPQASNLRFSLLLCAAVGVAFVGLLPHLLGSVYPLLETLLH